MKRVDNRIDLNLFRILDAIYTCGGVSAAARMLHLTQPAVTHSLQRLRYHLGDPLFVRQGNHLVPTEKVRAMMPGVQAHLAGLQASAHAQTAFDPQRLDAQFAVGFRDILESIALPSLVAQIEHQAPQVRVVSRRVLSGDAERELASGAIDLLVDRHVQVGPRIVRHALAEDSLVVAMRADHPHARQLKRADYLAAGHVAVSSLGEPNALDTLLGQSGKFRKVRLVCQHYVSAGQVAAASDLLLTVPRSFAVHLADLLPIAIQPLPIRLKAFPIMAYWHESKHEDHAHLWFRKLVMATVRSVLPSR